MLLHATRHLSQFHPRLSLAGLRPFVGDFTLNVERLDGSLDRREQFVILRQITRVHLLLHRRESTNRGRKSPAEEFELSFVICSRIDVV